jgi:hypothetical protein
MRNTVILASAALAAVSLPAFAQNHDHGGGAGGPPVSVPVGPPPSLPSGPPSTIPVSPNANAHASGQVTGDVHARTDSHASDRAQTRTGASVDRSDNVRTDTRAATGAGAAVATPNYGGAACAPGLADRDPACVPPGQADRSFRVGQHLSGNFKYYTQLSGIPADARSQVPTEFQNNNYRYIYQPDRIYVVHRDTNTVTSVINLGG